MHDPLQPTAGGGWGSALGMDTGIVGGARISEIRHARSVLLANRIMCHVPAHLSQPLQEGSVRLPGSLSNARPALRCRFLWRDCACKKQVTGEGDALSPRVVKQGDAG